ncbi:MAG: tetratricopeptide repeat protein [Syntrophotaleaceae bacterium]
MNCSINHIFLTFLVLGTLLLPAQAAVSPQLFAVSKKDDLAGTQIRFEFSEVPAYRMAVSGQRVDLFFAAATAKPDLKLPREDGRLLKILVAQSRNELLISLLLRQVPARAVTLTEKVSPTVRLELFWQEGNDERPAIAFRISGLPTRQKNAPVSSPGKPSRYSGRWKEFFDSYQNPFTIDAPLIFSFPPLPALNRDLLPSDLAGLADRTAAGDWSGILDETGRVGPISSADRSTPFLLLVQAEALMKEARPKEALSILENFPPGRLPRELEERIDYLHGLALARTGQPYRALNRLKKVADSPSSGLRLHYLLLLSELALFRGDFQQALEILDSSGSQWPEPLEPLYILRSADAMAGIDQDKAREIYRELLNRKSWPKNKSYSLHRAAGIFFQSGEWELAARLYRTLLLHNLPASTLGQTQFAIALTDYRSGKVEQALKDMSKIIKDFPDTDSAQRAKMKMLDHGVLGGEEYQLLRALRDYQSIAREAGSRELREEAAFKYSLTLFLNGDRIRTIESLESFCRNFAGGSLRSEADALLADILPPLIESLVAEGKDHQAVVLVEKYRDLLLERHGQWSFLPALAEAFTRLGLFERGCRVYLYLLEKAEKRAEADRFYLPLVKLYADLEEDQEVEKYSRRYLLKFPEGKDRNAHFLFLLKSLQRLDRYKEAADMLKDRNRPTDNQIELVAERIFWHLGEYGWVINCASRLGDCGKAIPAEGLLLQAEAMRRMGRGSKALPLYQVLAADGTFRDQASFRCGEILLADGRRDEALKLWRVLAEKGKDPIWKKMAEDALEAAKF